MHAAADGKEHPIGRCVHAASLEGAVEPWVGVGLGSRESHSCYDSRVLPTGSRVPITLVRVWRVFQFASHGVLLLSYISCVRVRAQRHWRLGTKRRRERRHEARSSEAANDIMQAYSLFCGRAPSGGGGGLGGLPAGALGALGAGGSRSPFRERWMDPGNLLSPRASWRFAHVLRLMSKVTSNLRVANPYFVGRNCGFTA